MCPFTGLAAGAGTGTSPEELRLRLAVTGAVLCLDSIIRRLGLSKAIYNVGCICAKDANSLERRESGSSDQSKGRGMREVAITLPDKLPHVFRAQK